MLVIRDARPDDDSVIRQIAEAAYAQYIPAIGRRPAPMDADYGVLIARRAVRIAVDASGHGVGFVSYWPKGDAMYLDAIAVAPEAKGVGLGRRLIEDCEGAARREGLRVISLYTNLHMRANLTLYPHLGFIEVGRRHDEGFDRVFFEKRL